MLSADGLRLRVKSYRQCRIKRSYLEADFPYSDRSLSFGGHDAEVSTEDFERAGTKRWEVEVMALCTELTDDSKRLNSSVGDCVGVNESGFGTHYEHRFLAYLAQIDMGDFLVECLHWFDVSWNPDNDFSHGID